MSNIGENTDCLPGLQKNNDYMKLLIDSTDNIFVLLDINANVLYCSDNVKTLLEINDVNEIIQKPIKNINSIFRDRAFLKRSVERYNRLLSGEESFIENDVIQCPKKGKRLFRILHKLVRNNEDDFRGIALFLRDITDEYVQDEDRRITERLGATQMPCLLWDGMGKLLNCNKKASLALGLQGKSLQDVDDKIKSIQPEFQPDGRKTETVRLQFIEETIKKGYSQVELKLNKMDGSSFYVDITGVRASWSYGHRILAYLRDTTEIKAKEAEAKEAEERVKIMLDSTPLICILRDGDHNVIDCNREALKIFNAPDKEYFIKNYVKFYPEYQPDGQKSIEIVETALKNFSKHGVVEYEWEFQLFNGERLPVKTKLVLISWKGAECFLSYSRDLRQEKANEQTIRENVEQTRMLELQKEKAQAASEAKSQFLASMSHEIRTPMNTIIGLLDLMRTDNLDTEQMKYIIDIKRMSSVLLQIINDILDFHKIESGKLEFLPIHFNLYTFYQELASRHKYLADSKNLTFKSSFAAGLPRVVYGDELRINQIITNLITNAIKYTRKGYVNFTVDSIIEDEKECLVFTVEDSGIGIKEENFNILFDEFEQFDLHKNRGISGTGLGLPIAKRLAEMMGGHIWFKSEYNKGSVFTFSLPLVRGNIDKIAHPKLINNVIARPDTKVLVVDDNSGNITVAVGLLARNGITPDAASNGIQAIEMIKANRYDLVFMDHMMPEMDGVEATRNIRMLDGEYFKKLPIIALSANAVAGAKELFRDCGMNDFVTKPINVNELNRALLRWLPEEKILEQKTEDEITVDPEEEAALNELLKELVKIQDLNIADGLSRIKGDKKLYKDILWQFCNSVSMDVSALRKFSNSGQWRDYTIRIHGLKTVFANIGNQFMSDWAFSLEQAAMRGDIDKCISETNNFCSALVQFNSKLKCTKLMSDSVPKARKKKISKKDLRNSLEKLLLACNDFNAESAELIAKELLDFTINAQANSMLTTVHDMVLSFDYDKAAEAIVELIQSLQ